MIIIREGYNTVGVHFVACHAPYLARGWIKSLEMLNGPKQFSLFFNEIKVASTRNGIITVDNFSERARYDMQAQQRGDDALATAASRCDIDLSAYFNMTYQTAVTVVADEPPERQNYYFKQTWAQAYRADPDSKDSFEELPCLLMFNLRSDDSTATVLRTVPVPEPLAV